MVAFLRFLDANKAFDCVNHGVLFDKLAKKGVLSKIVRILMYWYSNHQMGVRLFSDYVNVSTSVRQGGILFVFLIST